MKIILKKEVANLGEAGEVVEVKTGYARNYLIPQGYAVAGTPSAIKQNEETIRQRAHKEAKLVADAQAAAAKIEAVEIKIGNSIHKITECADLLNDGAKLNVSGILGEASTLKQIACDVLHTHV